MPVLPNPQTCASELAAGKAIFEAPELSATPTHYPGKLPTEKPMRSGILWMIGVPIPLILLLAYCSGQF